VLKFHSPKGELFTISKMATEIDQSSKHKVFEISVVPTDTASSAEESKLSDLAFEGLGGPGAEQSHIGDVIVDVFPATSGISIDAGYRAHYMKDWTGEWSRSDGETAPGLSKLESLSTPSGDVLVLTSQETHEGMIYPVYYCENCEGDNAVVAAAGDLYDVVISRIPRNAQADHFHATVFAGPRRTAWDFPPIVFLEGKKISGQWTLAAPTRTEFISLVVAKLSHR
jgi:hypothetical protein